MQHGYISQFQVVPLLEAQGIKVSLPCDPECTYDLITDVDGCLSRAQVKSCTTLRRNRYRADIACGATLKRAYADGSVDFLIVHVRPEDAWYVIPLGAVLGQKWVSLYPHDQRGKYDCYRGAWDLLRGIPC